MIPITTPSERTSTSGAFMHRFRLRIATLTAVVALLAALPALLTGCIFVGGTSSGSGADSDSSMNGGSSMSGSSSSGTSTPSVNRLPEPSVGGFDLDLSLLSADQQAKLDEVGQYLFDQYQALGWQIMATSAGTFGDVYDWLDPNSVEGSQKEPPPTPTPEQMQLPDGIQLQLTELDVFPELRGPEGTIPVLRPSFWGYVLGDTGATSLDDWISNYQVVGAPSEQYRLYAGIVTLAQNRGAQVSINAFGGLIEPDTMSVLEMVVGCRDPNGEMRQQIGIAASRDNINNLRGRFFPHLADSVLRLQVEFLTEGPGVTGDKKGGWDDIVRGFVPANLRPYPPGTPFASFTTSTVGGIQYESFYQILLWNGNWWVGHNGHWLGHYPKELFDDATPIDIATPPNLIATKACEVAWYGEVAALTTAPWTKTDMGSGHPASDGWPNAAYFREPSYVSLDTGGLWYWPDSDPNVQSADPTHYVPACYSRTDLQSGPVTWERFFYVDGPGGDEPSCQYQ